MKVGLIGAVATDPAFRGQGLASRLTEELVERASQAGAELALLWGSEHKMYARLGFQLAGTQIRAPLSALSLGDPSKVSITTGWRDELFARIRERERGVVLGDADIRWYREHKNVLWYRAEENGRIMAYAALGRGIDLSNIVHEWGGEKAALANLLARVRNEHPQAELLGPGGPDSNAFGLANHKPESLALIRSLAPKASPASLWVWGLDAV
jgi:hypothetical protein